MGGEGRGHGEANCQLELGGGRVRSSVPGLTLKEESKQNMS
jgi:hypothetical protein